MTYRTLPLHGAQSIEIRAGADVHVIGWDDVAVRAHTTSFLGVSVERRGDVIRVSFGGSGDVRVPRDLPLQVHAGRSATIDGIAGPTTAYAGWNLSLRSTGTLLQASSGGWMDLACDRIAPDLAKVSAGRDLRWQVADLADVRLGVHDIGGWWEIAFGAGSRPIQLNSGGDVCVVTDQTYRVTTPNGIVGQVETPTAPASAS